MFVGGRDVGKKLAVRTGTYSKDPVLKLAGIVEFEYLRGDDEAKGAEEYVGSSHVAEGIGLKLSQGNSVVPSYVLIE